MTTVAKPRPRRHVQYRSGDPAFRLASLLSTLEADLKTAQDADDAAAKAADVALSALVPTLSEPDWRAAQREARKALDLSQRCAGAREQALLAVRRAIAAGALSHGE